MIFVPQRVVIQTQHGQCEYLAFNDNVELSMAYRNGEVVDGDDIVYRNAVCTIIGTVRDAEGLEWTELMPLAPLQNLTFTIHM